MKRLNNERGAALILVLFGITLAMLFIMFQMGQLISTKTQVTSAEKNIDSKNITKMAADRFNREVSKKLGVENSDVYFDIKIVDEITTKVIDIKKSLEGIDEPIDEKLDDNHSYTIDNIKYAEGILKFEVVGEAYKKRTTWDGEIKIKQE